MTRHPSIQSDATPDEPRPWLAVWLPWMLAPCFLFLPIGGCGVAAAIRQPRLAQSAVPLTAPALGHPPLVPVGAILTVAQPPRF